MSGQMLLLLLLRISVFVIAIVRDSSPCLSQKRALKRTKKHPPESLWSQKAQHAEQAAQATWVFVP